MRFFSKGSVLYRYLATYIGIAIAACAIVGTVLFASATNQLAQEARQAEQVRLDMCRDDLVNTFEIMENIALRIRTGSVYQPYYLSKGAISHMTMLESFGQYQNYSPLLQQYYLYYTDIDKVFTYRAEYPFYLFVQTYLNMETDLARQLITQGGGSFPISETKYLFCYPLTFVQMNSQSKAYLLFEMDMNTLKERFSTMFMLGNPVEVCYNNQKLLTADITDECLESTVQLSHGNLTLRMMPAQNGAAGFQTRALLVIIFITLGISIASAVVAWKTYLPIRRLAKRIKPEDSTEQNEMKLIEGMMENLSEEKQVTMEQLTGSLERITTLTAYLRKQILLQLLSGQKEEDWRKHILHCGMILDRPFLCVVQLLPKSEENMEELLSTLESNATADIAVYGVILPDHHSIAAILSANEDEELNTFCRTLPSALFREGYEVTVRQGNIVNHLSELADSYCSAQNPQEENSSDTAAYDVKDMDQIRAAIGECDREKALTALDSILVDVINSAPSMLMQRYYIVQLTYLIVSCAREHNVFLPETIVQQVVMAANSQLLCDRLRLLLNRVLDERQPTEQASVLPEKNQKLMSYISDHAYDCAMCLDMVAEAFDISGKQVSRIVKSACGETFKDYLLRLRMEKAILLLKEGLPTAQVAEQVGYTDSRYFKKRFFEYTGDSVMKYQGTGTEM